MLLILHLQLIASCTDASTSDLCKIIKQVIILKVENSAGICEACHSDCVAGKCTEGGNAATCTECSSSTKYLNSGSCVLASACTGGLFFKKLIIIVAINATDSASSINICSASCTDASTSDLCKIIRQFIILKVENSAGICEACHSDCVAGKCTEGGNAATCTECSSSTKYLDSGTCKISTACTGG